MTTLRLDEIELGKRFRKDLGDVTELAVSIAEVGLLHPIVITKDGRLIAGARRLEACRSLDWQDIPVHVAESIVGAAEELIAERDENTCRLDMKRSEQVALGIELEKLVKPFAEERRLANLMQGSMPTESREEAQVQNSVKAFAERGDTRDIVGAAVGMSASTYQKAKAIVNDTKSDDPEIRAAAKSALEKMDETGKVDPNYRELQRARSNAPAPGEFATWDKSSERYRLKVEKIIQGVWDSLNRFEAAAPNLAGVDMEVLCDNLSTTEFEDMERMAASTIKELNIFRRNLKDHKPTQGG
jgi:ParB-like chromosome segregation protein Spo0J